jgi:hypothetical protein
VDTHKKQHQAAWAHPDTEKTQEFTVAGNLTSSSILLDPVAPLDSGKMVTE